ncbi:hypothetical protein NDU88_002335 [Pleurodeles waltl]|uniref:Uncharacterized protein n=1 Tax=Pleurodeles waltl TaxID=8319 RepID=A0AAV7WKX3_PLEWA|nr:hypothetical protein NDU88_002335 [Pleurodeles waltl]
MRLGGLAPGSADARLTQAGLRFFPGLVCPGAVHDKGRSSGPSGAEELGVRHVQPLGHAPITTDIMGHDFCSAIYVWLCMSP